MRRWFLVYHTPRPSRRTSRMRLAGNWLLANDSQMNGAQTATNWQLRRPVNWHMVYQTKRRRLGSLPRLANRRPGKRPRKRRTVDDIASLLGGFAVALSWYNVLLMMLGILLGVIIGVLPGLGGANGVAILLPLTFSMPPTSAIIMLSCIYWGALFGGAITSILFNIPGEPWSVATTFDGHPMAQ